MSMQKLLRISLIALIFFLLFAIYFHTITAFTQDLGRHLLIGEIIVKTKQVPTVNLFSYTYPLFPFINHHWFSEVLFYLFSLPFGVQGLFIITIIFSLVAFGNLFIFCFR